MIHRYRIRTGGTPRSYLAANHDVPEVKRQQTYEELMNEIAGVQACMMMAEKDGPLFAKLQELERKALDRLSKFIEGEGDGKRRTESNPVDRCH